MRSRNSEDLSRTPLIGKFLEVIEVTGGTYKGLKGTVVDERMNVVKIINKGQEKLIPKEVCIFQLSQNGRFLGRVHGRDLVGRPENRCVSKGG